MVDPPSDAPAANDILGLGCVAVDDLLYVETYPAADAKVRVRRRIRQCGGQSATALVTAARLGARCSYAGILGHDEDSAFVVETFRREGIDVAQLVRRDGARPIHSTILVDETHHTRTIFFDLTGSVGAPTESPPAEVIRAASVLSIDHYGIEGMTRAARIAREAGVAVVADLERDEWPGFSDLLALVDHLIVSQAFAARRTGEPDPAAAALKLWAVGRRVVAVTCGAQGCWYVGAEDSTVVHHQPAFRVVVADSTGCGDVFHGAYAAALVRGLGLTQCLRFASAAAALKAMQPGGQSGIPNRAAVETFLASDPSVG